MPVYFTTTQKQIRKVGKFWAFNSPIKANLQQPNVFSLVPSMNGFNTFNSGMCWRSSLKHTDYLGTLKMYMLLCISHIYYIYYIYYNMYITIYMLYVIYWMICILYINFIFILWFCSVSSLFKILSKIDIIVP